MNLFDDYVLDDCTLVDEHGIRWMKEGLRWKDFLRTRFKMRRKHPAALEYLQQYVDDFPWGRFCLERGKVSRSESYRIIRNRIDNRGFLEEGHCYRNAMRILRGWKDEPPIWIGDQTVSYVEGLALDPTGIFLHGWIDVGGVAYDRTFQRAYMTTYFGVHFDPLWSDQTMKRIGKYGMFHWWDRSKPILEERLVV